MAIILFGLPACGKTTLGKKAADIAKSDWIDTDRIIEEIYFRNKGAHLTCREIMLQQGEPSFREYEKKAIELLPNQTNLIISIGGGTLLDQTNQETLRGLGRLVYLKACNQIILERLLARQPLPSYIAERDPVKSLQLILDVRLPLYEKLADHIIDLKEKNEASVIEEIVYLTKFL